MIKILIFLIISNSAFNISINSYEQTGIWGHKISAKNNLLLNNEWIVDNVIDQFRLYLYFGKYSFLKDFFKKSPIANSVQAIERAELELVRKFGLKVLKQEPFIANLLNNKRWVIRTTLPSEIVLERSEYIKDTCRIHGGTYTIELNKYNGKVLNIIGYK